MNALLTFAQTSQSNSDGNPLIMLIALAAAVVVIVAIWKTFEKAKQPGWAAIIPIYNTYILLKIVGRPGWWLLLYLIPIVGYIVHLFVSIDLAKSFGKDTAFGVLAIWIFPIVGYYMLAFGDATYQGPTKTPTQTV